MIKSIFLFKKIISFTLVFTILFSLFPFHYSNAVSTNWLSSPWTIEKATHLAKRALIWVNPQIIQDLYNAWSAENAVNLLFPSPSWVDRTSFNQAIDNFKWPTFNPSDTNSMRKLYAYRYYIDQYEAKRKLFSLFEDIFPVDRTWNWINDISYLDVENHFNLLFDNSLWNYKTLIKKVLFDSTTPENSFAMGTYLDLLNQPDKNYPNENYARELMQLFLMWEYKPWENWDNPLAVRNYTEEDVAAFARILTWFRAWSDKKVTFDNNYHNTSTWITFLTWSLSSWDSFSFYNSASWTIDNTSIINPISWNNWLWDNAIDYIFSKRKDEIAYFLSWRLLKFYVKDTPTENEIKNLWNTLLSNNFELYPTIKTLLSSDILYSDEVMNSLRYKNPLELAIWTLKLLHYKNPQTTDELINDTSLLTNLDWVPYNPRSIFWRGWFDDNKDFMNAYFHNQWSTFASKIAFNSQTWSYNLSDLIPVTRKLNSWSIDFETNNKNTFSWTINLSNLEVTFEWNTINFATWTIKMPEFYVLTNSWNRIDIAWNYNLETWNLTTNSWTITYWTWKYIVNNFNFTVDSGFTLERDITPSELIEQLENYLYLGVRLPNWVSEKLKNFLLFDDKWNKRLFLPNDNTYRNKYIKWVLAIMLAQSEYILLNWIDLNESSDNSWSTPINNQNSKLIMVELNGWYDWMNWIIPKQDFSYYQTIRQSLAIDSANLIDLWDVYLNKSLEAFKPYFDNWDLRIINRVWTPNHSRAHDSAQIQVASKNGSQSVWAPGLIWELIKNDPNPLNNIVLWTSRPPIYTNWNFINIGQNSIKYKNNTWTTTNDEKTYQINTLKDILNNRQYPLDSKSTFKNSIVLDNVANSWQESVWWTLSWRLNFVSGLINNWLWITYYVPWGWWYDTHGEQLMWSYNLNDRTHDLSNDITTFFQREKDAWKDVTIIIYSEFWRTLKANWWAWTDHWQWWWYFILSTNNAFKNSLPQKVTWKLEPKKEYNDWFGVWIDYRSIYNKILSSLYNIDVNSYFGWNYNLDDDLNTTIPTPNLMRVEYKEKWWWSVWVSLKFKVDDKNFRFKDWSYLKLRYWENKNNLKEFSKWTMDNYTYNKNDNSFNIEVTLPKEKTYYYELDIVDNQYDKYTASWIINTPKKFETNSTNTTIPLDKDSYFAKYKNTLVSWNTSTDRFTLFNNPVEEITLSWWTNSWTTIYSWSIKDVSFNSWITLSFWTWETFFDTLTNSWVWNWWFKLPTFINKNEFIWENAVFNTQKLKDLNIENILKIWADSLWVWIKLNQKIKITLPIKNQSANYKILKSEDWINWIEIISIKNWSNISFETNNFTYFALVNDVVVTPPVTPPVVSPPVTTPPSSWWGGWWWGSLNIDNCPSWDYSPSYYDGMCEKKEVNSTNSNTENNKNNWSVKDKKYVEDLKQKMLQERQNAKKDGEVVKYIEIQNYKVAQIEDYKISSLITRLSLYIILNPKIKSTDKSNYIERFNEFLIARYLFEKQPNSLELKNKHIKQTILLKNVVRKLSGKNYKKINCKAIDFFINTLLIYFYNRIFIPALSI